MATQKLQGLAGRHFSVLANRAFVRWYPYQCRHTYASMMVSAGESPEWVAEQMGHLDGRLVAAVYGKWLRPSSEQPGRRASTVYAAEWAEAKNWICTEEAPLGQAEAAAQAAAEAAAAGQPGKDEE